MIDYPLQLLAKMHCFREQRECPHRVRLLEFLGFKVGLYLDCSTENPIVGPRGCLRPSGSASPVLVGTNSGHDRTGDDRLVHACGLVSSGDGGAVPERVQ